MEQGNKRIYSIDTWRGLCVIHMVTYHLLYDLVELFDAPIPWFWSWSFQTMRDFFAGGFIFLAGVSCYLSRNNRKRGIRVFGFAMLLSMVTYLAMPDQFIAFGILHLLGSCMLLFALFERQLKQLNSYWWVLLFAFLYLLLGGLPHGYIGQFHFVLRVPEVLYSTPFLFPFGLPNSGFASSDYYPLFPWIFVFLSGVVAGRKLKEKKLPNWVYRCKGNPISWLGSHSLIIYLLHQPVLYGAVWLWFCLTSQ